MLITRNITVTFLQTRFILIFFHRAVNSNKFPKVSSQAEPSSHHVYPTIQNLVSQTLSNDCVISTGIQQLLAQGLLRNQASLNANRIKINSTRPAVVNRMRQLRLLCRQQLALGMRRFQRRRTRTAQEYLTQIVTFRDLQQFQRRKHIAM